MSEERNAWMPEDVTLLRQMVSDFATGPELAKKFGRSTGAIYTKLSSLGLKIKKRPENTPHQWIGSHPIPRDKPPTTPPTEAIAPAPVQSPPKNKPEQPLPPMNMVDFASVLRNFIEDGMGDEMDAGAAKIVGFGGYNDDGQAAVVFELDGRRYRLRLEKMKSDDSEEMENHAE